MHVQEDAESRRGRMCVIEHVKLVVPDATASLLALMATKVSVPAMPSSRLIVTSPSALSYLLTVPCLFIFVHVYVLVWERIDFWLSFGFGQIPLCIYVELTVLHFISSMNNKYSPRSKITYILLSSYTEHFFLANQRPLLKSQISKCEEGGLILNLSHVLQNFI